VELEGATVLHAAKEYSDKIQHQKSLFRPSATKLISKMQSQMAALPQNEAPSRMQLKMRKKLLTGLQNNLHQGFSQTRVVASTLNSQ